MNTSTKPLKGHAPPRVHPSPTPPTSAAQKRAALMLEVFAGLRSAAGRGGVTDLGQSLLSAGASGAAGLVAACEPRPKGQRTDPQRQVHALEQALARSRQECQRQAALVRATQRAMGLPAAPRRNPRPANRGGVQTANPVLGNGPRPSAPSRWRTVSRPPRPPRTRPRRAHRS